MAVNLDILLINLIINIIVVSPILWIAGRLLAGKDKAKFTDALWIVILGNIKILRSTILIKRDATSRF